VETGFINKPQMLFETMFQLEMSGYKPILAHPERYQYLIGDKSLLEDMVDRKILFQINLLSLTGFYSKPVKDFAESLMERELVKFFGTDCHNVRYLDMLETLPKQKSFSQIKRINWMNTSL
jgi:tyrosine-protein phosphatase YwqE